MLSESDVLKLLRDKVDQCGSQAALAAEIGVSQQYMTDVLKRRRAPGKAIQAYLGLRRIAYYERVKR